MNMNNLNMNIVEAMCYVAYYKFKLKIVFLYSLKTVSKTVGIQNAVFLC